MHAIWLRFIAGSVNSENWEEAGHCVPDSVRLHEYSKAKKEMKDSGRQVSNNMEPPEV